jgi:hypothetical protein
MISRCNTLKSLIVLFLLLSSCLHANEHRILILGFTKHVKIVSKFFCKFLFDFTNMFQIFPRNVFSVWALWILLKRSGANIELTLC